jgi:hypothetical protein
MRISKLISKFVWPVNALKYKSLKGLNSRKDFYKIIERERERSNRNNHQVSLVVFNLDSFPDNGKERKQLINNINKEKRSIDDIGWFKKHSVGVILPYTPSYGAREFSVRVSRTLNFIMPDSFCYLYTYPLEDKSDDDTESKDNNAAESIADGVESMPDDVESTADDVKIEPDDNVQIRSLRSV